MEIDPRIQTAAQSLAPALDALFLAGSHGRGTADAVSDIDLLGIAPPDRHAEVMNDWRAALEAQMTLALWQQPYPSLANAIGSDFLRVDLFLIPPEALTARAKSTIKPLHDPEGLWNGLQDTLPPAAPDPATVQRLTNEFLRVLGLTHVGLVREEYVLLVRGAGTMRDMLMDLMTQTSTLPDKGGMLHPSRVLNEEQMAQLAALPVPAPERDAVLAATLATADLFLPLARELAGDSYPTALEQAARDVLGRVGVHLS